MREPKPYQPGDFSKVVEAIAILRQARHLLVKAGARKTADRVRRALSSAYGARRHVQRRQFVARFGRPAGAAIEGSPRHE